MLLSGYFFHSTASTVPNQQSVYKYKEDKNLLQLISTLVTGTKLHNAQSTCGKTTPLDQTRASQTQYRKVSSTSGGKKTTIATRNIKQNLSFTIFYQQDLNIQVENWYYLQI